MNGGAMNTLHTHTRTYKQQQLDLKFEWNKSEQERKRGEKNPKNRFSKNGLEMLMCHILKRTNGTTTANNGENRE